MAEGGQRGQPTKLLKGWETMFLVAVWWKYLQWTTVPSGNSSWGEKTDFCRNNFHTVTHVVREEGGGIREPTLRKSCCYGPLMVDRSQQVKREHWCCGLTVRKTGSPQSWRSKNQMPSGKRLRCQTGVRSGKFGIYPKGNGKKAF